MTKFPEGSSTLDGELAFVIDLVRKAVHSCGFTPRVADKNNQYHDLLWDNVELHLLGCKQGIAIVEDKYKPELNPNVAKEWGWMRGMGRRVLYLREMSFAHDRADWSGLIVSEFEWARPKAAIRQAVRTWLSRLA